MIARAAMQYVLLRCGKPIIDIGLSETEYNTMTSEAIRSGDDSAVAGAIGRAAVQKEIAFGDR
jgi:hypothetical protein